MKKISVFILCILFIQMGRAQTQIATTTDLTINAATAKLVPDENARVIITPFLCDYEMLTKGKDGRPVAVYDTINSQITVKSIANNAKTWIDNYETLVIAKMMRKYGADAILSPTREAQTSDKGYLVVIVRGYPVKYVNFRVASEKDEWIWNTDRKGAYTTKSSTGTTITNH